jgi:hypothetical protein
MSFQLTDIDHLMIRVADLNRGVAEFTALGFTVAPPRRQFDPAALAAAAGAPAASVGRGRPLIDNRLVLFQPFPGRTDVANYLEIMCIVDQWRMPSAVTHMLSFLLDSEGPKSIVCHTESVHRSREAMLQAGIDVHDPVSLETGWWDDVDQVFVPIRASPAAPVFGQIPFQLNPYATDTLEGYHHRRWTKHPNSARYLAGITGVTERIAEHGKYMAETVFGVPLEWESDDIVVLRPRDLFLRIVTPRGFTTLYPDLDFSSERILPFVVGATIAVDSVVTVRGFLDDNQISWVRTPRGIAVPRRYAANTLLEFVPTDG